MARALDPAIASSLIAYLDKVAHYTSLCLSQASFYLQSDIRDSSRQVTELVEKLSEDLRYVEGYLVDYRGKLADSKIPGPPNTSLNSSAGNELFLALEHSEYASASGHSILREMVELYNSRFSISVRCFIAAAYDFNNKFLIFSNYLYGSSSAEELEILTSDTDLFDLLVAKYIQDEKDYEKFRSESIIERPVRSAGRGLLERLAAFGMSSPDPLTNYNEMPKSSIKDEISSHPGKSIEQHLIGNGWSAAYAAEKFGVSREHIYSIMRGDTGISTSMARALERNSIGGTALDWLVLQAKYDLAQPERPSTPKRRPSRTPKS